MQIKIKCPECGELMEETECFDWEDRGNVLWRLCEDSCQKCKTTYVTEKTYPLGEPTINIVEKYKE